MRVPEADAEDVTSEVFLRAFERNGQFRSDDPGGWLFAIARSRVAEFHRRKGRGMKIETLALKEPKPVSTPLERMESAEFRRMLREKMELLSELERDVIAFKFTDGLTNVEIARALGVKPNHLGVLLHRALKKLRKALGGGSVT